MVPQATQTQLQRKSPLAQSGKPDQTSDPCLPSSINDRGAKKIKRKITDNHQTEKFSIRNLPDYSATKGILTTFTNMNSVSEHPVPAISSLKNMPTRLRRANG